MLKRFINQCGSSDLYIENSRNPLNRTANKISVDFRSNYLLNSKLSSFSSHGERAISSPADLGAQTDGLERFELPKDCVLLVGSNPRDEASLFNVRLRQLILGAQQQLEIASIGGPMNLTYPVNHLGNGSPIVLDIVQGKSYANRGLISSRNPLLIFGLTAFQRVDGASLRGAFDVVLRFRNAAREALSRVVVPSSPTRRNASDTVQRS